MRAPRNDDKQVIITPCPSSLMSLPIILGHVETVKNDHLWLAFGCKGGGSGSCIGTTKITTSGLHLDAREVVVVGGVLEE